MGTEVRRLISSPPALAQLAVHPRFPFVSALVSSTAPHLTHGIWHTPAHESARKTTKPARCLQLALRDPCTRRTRRTRPRHRRRHHLQTVRRSMPSIPRPPHFRHLHQLRSPRMPPPPTLSLRSFPSHPYTYSFAMPRIRSYATRWWISRVDRCIPRSRVGIQTPPATNMEKINKENGAKMNNIPAAGSLSSSLSFLSFGRRHAPLFVSSSLYILCGAAHQAYLLRVPLSACVLEYMHVHMSQKGAVPVRVIVCIPVACCALRMPSCQCRGQSIKHQGG